MQKWVVNTLGVFVDLLLNNAKVDSVLDNVVHHLSHQNELSIYELVHNFVEVLDKYFSRVVSVETRQILWLVDF